MPNLVQSVFLITMETSLQFTVCYIHCLFLGKFVFILPSIYDNELCIFVTLNMCYSRGGGNSVVVWGPYSSCTPMGLYANNTTVVHG